MKKRKKKEEQKEELETPSWGFLQTPSNSVIQYINSQIPESKGIWAMNNSVNQQTNQSPQETTWFSNHEVYEVHKYIAAKYGFQAPLLHQPEQT